MVIPTEEPGSSGEEDASAEVISSPPHRPITRSVSAKRAADEMVDGSIPSSPSPPRPRKVQKRNGKPGISHNRYRRLIVDLLVGPLSKTPLFVLSSSPEPIAVDSTSNAAGEGASSHLDKDYFLLENPWSEKIKYF
jgi:hypothetical protein